MKCRQCGTVLVGRKQGFCSDKCRMRSKRAKVEQRTLTLAMLDSLPDGVSRPTAQPTPETAGVHAVALMDGMNRHNGIAWLDSPEYAEVVYRLLTSSVEQLEAEGQFIPGWKAVA